MKTYTLTHTADGCPVAFRQPDRIARAGDVYAFTKHPLAPIGAPCVVALSGTVYYPGDRLAVIERTEEAPHQIKCSLGNLRVVCKARTSIWSNIDMMIEERLIELVERRITEEDFV